MNELAAALIAALAPVFAWVGRKVLSRLDKLLTKFDSATEKLDLVHQRQEAIDTRVNRLDHRVTELSKEFKPNGGASIRDTLDEMREKLTILDGRHRARFDGDGLATYECGPDGECTYASAALGELFGLPPEEIHGRGWLKAIATASERIRAWTNWEAAVKAQIPYEDVYVIQRPNGTQERVRTYVRCTKGSNGKVLCYHGVVTVLSPNHS